MNKTILAFCLLFAFTSIQAQFTPEWTNCDKIKPYRTWETLSVTLDAAPVAGQISSFTYCGKSHTYEFFLHNLTVTSGTGLELVFPEDGNIWNGSEFCAEVSFEMPKDSKDLNILLVMNGVALPAAGCAHVTLHLENNHKFLSHSF